MPYFYSELPPRFYGRYIYFKSLITIINSYFQSRLLKQKSHSSFFLFNHEKKLLMVIYIFIGIRGKTYIKVIGSFYACHINGSCWDSEEK